MYWLDNNTGISTAPTPPAVISLTKRFFSNGGLGEQPSIPEDFWFNMIQEELLGVLTMAGIAPVKNDLGQLAKAIQSIAFSAYPVGSPIPWPTAVPPAGFIVMTGQSFSPITYPMLALAYPSLVLPDMRAQGIRGWDNGLGIDSGRALLSLQGDAMRKITGTLSGIKSNVGLGPTHGTGAFVPDALADSNRTLYGAQQASSNGTLVGGSFDSSLVVPTAPEVRIKTIAFNFITRAA